MDKPKNEEKKADKNFVAREYQVEIFEKAREENVIVFLPTGAGKTFIAIMLIKEYIEQVKMKYSEGGKRIFFLVNSTPLVKQQAEATRNLSGLEVGEYTGDAGVDLWDSSRWIKEQDMFNVLVMTSQIYLNMILGKFTRLDQACLIIFDECHQAVKDHPMRQIMMELKKQNHIPLPRILGLTATLLNSNVKPEKVETEIKNLEDTFHARVERAINQEMVNQYSANPDEVFILYKEENPKFFTHLIDQYLAKIDLILDVVKCPEILIEEEPKNATLLNDTRSKSLKKIKLGLKDTWKTSQELGLFAADISILSLIILIHRFKMTSHDTMYRVLSSIETGLHLLRKKFSYHLNEVEPSLKPLLYASDKVLKLIELLKDFHQDNRAIVFVDRRSTAHALHYIFLELRQNNETFKNIKADYIVGVNQSEQTISRENILSRKKNKIVMKKFNEGELNVLFASNVIEEGVDIRACNLVIKFDMPKTFRSYTQSKGRARHKSSKYYIIAAEAKANEPNIYECYSKFKSIENVLKKVLCERILLEDTLIDDTDDDDDVCHEIINSSGAKVTACQAISLINHYCSLLPQDKFSKLTSLWWVKNITENGENKFVGYLKLPINSAIKTMIQGIPRKSKLSAKRFVALEACQMLYNLGEFNEHLLPWGKKLDLLNDNSLFPKWREEYFKQKLTATDKKQRHFYNKHYTKWECNSKPTPGSDVFMHIIKIVPNYEYPDTNRLQSFYNLLLCDNTFCLLTSCSWPELPEFPLFMNVGEVSVEILTNSSFILLTEDEIRELENFHKLLFTDALPLLKKYSVQNEPGFCTDDYIIAPVSLVNSSYTIDWSTVRNEKKNPEIKPKPLEKRLDDPVTEEEYHMKIVIPWYRHEDFNLKYVVTNVRMDQNPLSDFPSQNFKNYADYFLSRYKVKIYDMSQPLLEVRAISSKINCILPRAQYHSSRRQMKEDDGFEETLIPELCYLITFPAWYLVKVTLLPSALHRIHYLLIAEELRQKIVQETQLGTLELPSNVKWEKLKVDDLCKWQQDEDPSDADHGLTTAMVADVDDTSASVANEVEPLDLDRHLSDIDLTAVLHYSNYVDKSVEESDFERDVPKPKPVIRHKAVTPPKVIKGRYPGYGPEPIEILEAITAASSNDIINYERTELMGDSFLKFAVSLALFTHYPNHNEGQLTQVKGKIIGNTNLFFCGLDLNLPGLLKVNAFDFNDWKIPGFSLSPKLIPHLKDPIICSTLLGKLALSESLDLTADISQILQESNVSKNSAAIESNNLQNNEAANNTSDDSDDEDSSYRKVRNVSSKDEYLMKHLIPEKVISDSVEAIISVYVQNFGIEGGFKILKWLGILPDSMCKIELMLHSTPVSPLLSQDCDFFSLIPNAEELESTLGYKFKNKAFLLQALTHSSYPHGMTDCFQRYEFLGDAILDFLLTAYIFEECKGMKPGDMTDLRSALVNNVTFACLAVRHKLHTHIISRACKLTDIISRFVKSQIKRNHEIGNEVFYLIEESDVNVAECIDVPKVLGDVFESIIAAIYLDSGRDLSRVWTVIYNLMENEIKKFSQDIPKNAIRLIYEKFTKHPPKYGKSEIKKDAVMIPLEIIHNETSYIFNGVGENKYFAKVAAAKHALRRFKNN